MSMTGFSRAPLLAILLLGACLAPAALRGAESADLPNFRVVEEGKIYRGGQPTLAGLRLLHERYGVKTVIDLRNEASDLAAWEEKTAGGLSLEFRRIAMSSLKRPSDTMIGEIEALLTDPARQPVYVHCHHGQDRTGLVIGLFRVISGRWTAAKAYDEMLASGFHPTWMWSLKSYFREATSKLVPATS